MIAEDLAPLIVSIICQFFLCVIEHKKKNWLFSASPKGATQNMLDDIAEKYNRPHRKTSALLSGLIYCPFCGKRLRVVSESNRWTNGKPRFKYVCPGYRENECTFQSVDGVLLDEFVVLQLSNLSDEDSEYFTKLLNQRASDIFKNSHNEQELTELKKKKAQLETAISNQVKNMRDASDDLKRFIQEDIQELSNELREVGILLESKRSIVGIPTSNSRS